MGLFCPRLIIIGHTLHGGGGGGGSRPCEFTPDAFPSPK